mmetsp:Transcript_41977/g.100048  ORF Transcript_41977/g.100048 Transcript_41977/m.100048 type:complete len:204 (-) Transcript_41977:1865-2476(-)
MPAEPAPGGKVVPSSWPSAFAADSWTCALLLAQPRKPALPPQAYPPEHREQSSPLPSLEPSGCRRPTLSPAMATRPPLSRLALHPPLRIQRSPRPLPRAGSQPLLPATPEAHIPCSRSRYETGPAPGDEACSSSSGDALKVPCWTAGHWARWDAAVPLKPQGAQSRLAARVPSQLRQPQEPPAALSALPVRAARARVQPLLFG